MKRNEAESVKPGSSLQMSLVSLFYATSPTQTGNMSFPCACEHPFSSNLQQGGGQSFLDVFHEVLDMFDETDISRDCMPQGLEEIQSTKDKVGDNSDLSQ
jgi:hypothetical protein